MHVEEEEEEEEEMEEEKLKKGAKGRPCSSSSNTTAAAAALSSDSGSESESDEMKISIESKNEEKKTCAAEKSKKDEGQDEIEEEEEEEEDEESDEEEEEEEDEEEESEEDDDDDDDIGVINKKNRKKLSVLESESSDDGEGDDCPICLNRLKYQDIGTPEACDHNFCLDCIQLWARNVNTCPVDRREFQLILARHAREDDIFKKIPVSGKSFQTEDDDADVNEDFTYCELCGRSDREDRLLLCDGCDLGFHCECLDPPLDSVPVEEWFCPDCAEANTQRSGRMLNDLDAMQYLLEENSIDGIPYLRPRRRQIARTRISERVRARIQEYREGLARLVCDDEEPEASDEEGEGPSTRLSRTRSQTRQSETKRKQSSRKKTKKGTTGKQKSSYTKKKLRRRTKTPGKAQIFDRLQKVRTSRSKSRLAGRIGLTKSRMSLRKSDRATAAQILKEDLYGAKPLSITGGKHDLDPFPDDDSYNRSDEPQASTSVFSASAAAKRSSKYSASALLSRQPVARPLLRKLPEDNPGSNIFSSHCSNSGASSAASSSGGLDLLGSIMMDQNLLHLESKDVKINRDGSLTAKKAVTASVIKERKQKTTCNLFFDSKDDENSNVHMDSDNEMDFECSSKKTSFQERNNTNNNDTNTGTEVNDDDDEGKKDSPDEELIDIETETKCSDVKIRDSETDIKPCSSLLNTNEISEGEEGDKRLVGGESDEEEKDEGGDVEEDSSFESHGTCKTEEEINVDGNEEEEVNVDGNEEEEVNVDGNEEEEEMKESRTEPTETDVENQTTELNEDKVWSEKAPGRNQSSDSEGVEEEDNNNQDGDGTYKDEPKDGCSSKRVDDDDDDDEESEDNEEEVEAGSEQESSGFSPAAGVSPRDEENQDVEQNSDEEMVKTEEAVPAAELVSEEEEEEEENIREASSGDDKIEEPSEDFENIQDKQGPEDGLKREEVADNVEEEEEEGKEAVDETNSTSSPLLAEPTGEEDEEDVVKEEEEEEAEMSGEHTKCLSEEEEEENNRDIDAEQNGELALESNQAGDQEEFARTEESEENGEEALAVENLAEEEEERDKKEKLEEVVEEISEHYDDSASKDSEEMVKSHREELENFERQNEIGDEKISPVSGSESDLSSAGNGGEEEEEEEKPKVPISELPRIPKRNRREGYRREKTSKGGDGPELKSVLGRVDMGEYKMGRSWEKKESRRTRWDPDEWGQAEREAEGLSTRDRKSEGGKSYHSDRSESSRESEKYSFEYKESKSRKRRRERSRSRSRGHKESVVEYRDIPHHRHSPERSKNRRRNRSRSGSREKSFDYDKSHKRKSRGRSRDRSQSRKSRRHRSYSRSPSRKRDKERGSLDKRRHREERKRGEERTHKRHSDKSDPDESRKKRSSHEEFDEWDDGSCQVVDFDESGTPPKATTSKKSAECFYEAQMSNEKISENFFNRSRPQEKGLFKTDKVEDSAPFYNARGSNKKHKFVDRFYKAPHLRNPGTEKFPIHLSEDESEEINIASKASRCSDDHEKEANSQDSGDSEYDPAFPTESGSPLREGAIEEEEQEQPAPPKILEESTPLSTVVTVTAAAAATSIGTTTTTTAEAVVVPPPPPTTTTAVAEELASSGPIDEAPPTGSQGILGESGFLIAESPNLQNIPMQPQNITFPMGIRMMPPGMQPGMPQHLLMNPMFLNRPPPFGRLPRISGPVGRLGWSMNPSGLMQIPPNRFGPARMGPGGAMPPSPGLLNGGGFDGIPQEPGQPVPPFKQHPCDPRNISSHTGGPQGPPGQIAPRAGLPPPHLAHIPPPGPLLQHPPPPPPSSQQMHIPPPTSDPLSSLSLDSQTVPLHIQHGLGKNAQPSSDENSASSNFCVPELNQISKLIKAHAQALQNKQRNPSSLQGGDIDVFKIPLPPMAPPAIPPPTLGLPIVPPPESTTHNYTSTTKLYKNGQSKLLANSHTSSELASESTEVVDMDVASPLDDEVAIELPASPELDDIDESKINMKDSSVIELSVPEDMPASAVELTNLTNKEKHPSSQRIKKSNRKSSQQRTVSPTSTKTSYMGYMKKLQIQERVVDEVKLAIKPFYSGKKIDKNEYKEILRKSVPKICHSKSGNINPAKIKALIEAYVDKMCKTRRYMERKKKGSLKANGEQQQMKKPSR